MPMIDLTFAQGTLSPAQQQTLLEKLTRVLMFWEKIPDTPTAKTFTFALAHELPAQAICVGGSPKHAPYYRIDIRIPANRWDQITKACVIRDVTRLVLTIEGTPLDLENARRVWVFITDVSHEDWGIEGHRDWLRGYISALDTLDTSANA